jgi:hypothetical protein
MTNAEIKGSKTMKTLLSIVGIILILIGGVWFLQGINVIGGSVMTGQSQWAVIGSIAAVVGIGLLVFVNRRRGSPR